MTRNLYFTGNEYKILIRKYSVDDKTCSRKKLTVKMFYKQLKLSALVITLRILF